MDESSSLHLPPLDLPWIDGAGLVLVVVMLLLGALRGLWWQVMRLLGLLGAIVLANALAPRLSPHVAERLTDLPPNLLHGALWIAFFLAGLAVAALFGIAGRKLLATLKLGLVDRAGGALAGIATGALIHLPLVALIIQLAPPEWTAQHVGGSISASALDVLGSHWDVVAQERHGAEASEPGEPARGEGRPSRAGSSAESDSDEFH